MRPIGLPHEECLVISWHCPRVSPIGPPRGCHGAIVFCCLSFETMVDVLSAFSLPCLRAPTSTSLSTFSPLHLTSTPSLGSAALSRGCWGAPCHVISCRVRLRHVMSCHVMYVMSCHVMSCHVPSRHAMSCHMSRRAVSRISVFLCRVGSFFHVRSLFMSRHVTSYHVMFVFSRC